MGASKRNARIRSRRSTSWFPPTVRNSRILHARLATMFSRSRQPTGIAMICQRPGRPRAGREETPSSVRGLPADSPSWCSPEGHLSREWAPRQPGRPRPRSPTRTPAQPSRDECQSSLSLPASLNRSRRRARVSATTGTARFRASACACRSAAERRGCSGIT